MYKNNNKKWFLIKLWRFVYVRNVYYYPITLFAVIDFSSEHEIINLKAARKILKREGF